jgi:hypothetical protein
MWTDKQIVAAAAAAAEKANGGHFRDPLFYAPEHRQFWRDTVRTALDVATETLRDKGPKKSSAIAEEEVRQFCDHCVYIRSVFEVTRRLFLESDQAERDAMQAVAPRIFEDLSQVLTEFLVIAACRITDPPIQGGNENFTIGLLTDNFANDGALQAKLSVLRNRMEKHRYRLLPARNKLGAHADRITIKKGEPLGAAKWDEWDQFWIDLSAFVSLLHEHVFGTPFEIRATMVRGDAEMLLKKLMS